MVPWGKVEKRQINLERRHYAIIYYLVVQRGCSHETTLEATSHMTGANCWSRVTCGRLSDFVFVLKIGKTPKDHCRYVSGLFLGITVLLTSLSYLNTPSV